MADNNTKEIVAIALRAFEVAIEHRHDFVTLEHVVYALTENPEAQKCFAAFKIDSKPIQDQMKDFMESDKIGKTGQNPPQQSKFFDDLFTRVIGGNVFPKRPANAVDVLMHLLQYPHEDSDAITALINAGLTPLMIKKYLSHGAPKVKKERRPNPFEGFGDMMGGGMSSENEPTTEEEALETLVKYCVNLNDVAKEGKIDPLIGRKDIIEQITLIVSRRTKNNVALVGDPGVGKTAIAEGLAHRIVLGDVPKVMKDSVVFSLDITKLIAGTKFRGEFEDRMKNVLKSFEIIDVDAILFIDEIHMVMNAGAAGGSMDVANILKPALAKGKLRCIGSTTAEEYRKHFEKDRALARRFKKIVVSEPTIDEAKLILRGLSKVYGDFHSVVYSNEALDAAVDLTARYIHGAVLPDKAIDIMDAAGARFRILDFDGETREKKNISVADIEFEVSKVAKIPAKEVAEDEAAILLRLEDDLNNAVFDQPTAVKTLTDAVYMSRAGLREENKPAGSYLFTGPTGVGKTEVARQLAKTLNIPLIKFDMSEYMEKHKISTLIGSPPGYVGYSDGGAGDGLLINAIDTNPSCVLLLDEIEKAHVDLFNILLQVMDDSKLTGSNGKEVNFRNVIIIMTSNAGSVALEKKPIGFGRSELPTIDDKVVKSLFTPEFRNRLDATVNFDRLKPTTMEKIVTKFIDSLRGLAGARNVKIDINKKALKWLADKGYDPDMGARPLARVITDTIKKPLSRMMLVGCLKDEGREKTALIRVVDDKIVVTAKA